MLRQVTANRSSVETGNRRWRPRIPHRHGRACPGYPPPAVEAQMAGTTLGHDGKGGQSVLTKLRSAVAPMCGLLLIAGLMRRMEADQARRPRRQGDASAR